MISLGREYEVIFLQFFCLSFVCIVLALWEKVKGRQKCAAEEMKREPLAKRAGAYWPINSPKCCCKPSIPHFVSKDLSYGFAIDFFVRLPGSYFLQVQYVTETEKPISKSVRKKAISGALIVVPCLTFPRC